MWHLGARRLFRAEVGLQHGLRRRCQNACFLKPRNTDASYEMAFFQSRTIEIEISISVSGVRGVCKDRMESRLL